MANPEVVGQLTKDLVGIPSQNERRLFGDENQPYEEALFADRLHKWFQDRKINAIQQELPDGRKNVFAFVPGMSNKTVILAGHFDTVGVEDYQAKGLHPFDPDVLAAEQPQFGDEYIQGRGAFDMKSGIAVAMELMRKWNEAEEALPGSVLFMATCDEENNSQGVLHANDVLLRAKGAISDESQLQQSVAGLTEGMPLDYKGVINLDYTTQRYPGDPDYHVWAGTIGKLLPSVYIRGKETHAGEHFNGFHASTMLSRLVKSIDGNMRMVDGTVPPTTLKMTDNREAYDVMTASSGRAYFNVFTVGRTPAMVMDQVQGIAESELDKYSFTVDSQYKEYCDRMGLAYNRKDVAGATKIYRYSELLGLANEELGGEAVEAIIAGITEANADDTREVSFAVVEQLVNELKLDHPAIVLFFSPPFYPYIKPERGALTAVMDEAIMEASAQHGKTITREDFYPYISDMSYLKLEPEIAASLDGLTTEMPVWERGYEIDFDAISQLNLSVVNVGPYGFGAHQTEERVEKKYTFEILPEILDTMVRKTLSSR